MRLTRAAWTEEWLGRNFRAMERSDQGVAHSTRTVRIACQIKKLGLTPRRFPGTLRVRCGVLENLGSQPHWAAGAIAVSTGDTSMLR